MKFIKLLFREAGDARGWITFMSILPGIAQGILIAVVSTAADTGKTGGLQLQLLGIFAISCTISLFSINRALNATNEVVESYLNRVRSETTELVRHLNLASYEHVGQSRIYTVLSRDLQTISQAAPMVINAVSASLMLLCSALYIAYLSLVAFLLTVGLVSCAIYLYTRSQKYSAVTWRMATESEFDFQQNLAHLLNGFKEVKMSSRRGDDLLNNYLLPKSVETEHWKIEAGRQFNSGMTIANLFIFMLMGMTVFGLPQHIGDMAIAGRIITVIVYAGGAMDPILKALPAITKASVAIDNLEALEADLSEYLPEDPARDLTPSLSHTISGQELRYTYSDADGKPTFTLGPFDLIIPAGEIVFISGGNGSGKSTLVKILTSLYEPLSGSLLWDDTPVTRTNRNNYRNLFSVIFWDFHLFDRLYGMEPIDSARIDSLFSEMNLRQKVSFRDGQFSTLELSTGQRKRLAMIVTRLENRPVCVFDEWAADQDPQFRQYYYEILLPALRAEGHTVIATTHDDRFFHVADRIIIMDEGKIVRVEERK
jgi:putative pyoverdin transport system ATP-binding/permease protein